MRSLADEARAARHAAVLDEATREFTLAGVASAQFSSIARRVGLTRAALYNYCSDRHDLVHQCYIRTCDLIQSDLQRAALTYGRGLDKVATFIELVTSASHPPIAIFSETGLLSESQRASLLAAREQNVATLRSLLAGGIEDGSIRPCNAAVVSQAILGILSSAHISRAWLDPAEKDLPRRMAQALPEVVVDGAAARQVELAPMRKRLADVPMPSFTSAREKKLEMLARAGSRLFNERGIDGVTLDEVASELGLTKGVIYHAFDSKPAFVAFCYHRSFDIYERIIDVAAECSDGIEYTRAIAELHVELQLSDIHPLRLTTGIENFPPKLRMELVSRMSAVLDRTVELNERGIRDGSLRDFDIAPVKLASVGAFGFISQWLPTPRRTSKSALAREISNFLLFGLRR